MRTIIFFLIIILNLSCRAQGINNLWLMGYENISGLPLGGTDFDFTSGTINILHHPRLMNFLRTNAVISDSLGNLLFSSNGVFIANSADDTMLNGSGLNPGYYSVNNGADGLNVSQGTLILPTLSGTSKYYLFHSTFDDYGNTYCSLYLYFSIIDMSLDSGRGEVVQKNSVLLTDSLVPGILTACKHANGRDWWLITHQYNSNLFYKFLITPFGISGPFTQSIGSIRFSELTQSQFSMDGSKYASYEPPWNDLDILSFDRCSGIFYNPVHVDFVDSAYVGGVAFSPNSNLLYVPSTSYLYQFDLTSANIPTTQTTVATWDGYYSPQWPYATTFYLSQLAPDGKIYINCGNSTVDMHVINNPDSLGVACDVCQHCIPLPTFNGYTIPNYPNYFLGRDTGTICDSLTSSTTPLTSVNKFIISPNPTYNRLVITYASAPYIRRLSILDIKGILLKKINLPPWSTIQKIELSDFAQGIYIARLSDDNSSESLLFYKQ